MAHYMQDRYPAARPIFVLGGYSSGTTVMCDGLRHAVGIPGWGEGWLYATAHQIINRLPGAWDALGFQADAEGKAISQFEVAELQRHVLDFFHAMSMRLGVDRWVDKTPGVMQFHACELLLPAYPHAQFVFMRRNGLRVVQSRINVLKSVGFEQHCRDWRQIMQDYGRYRERFGDRILEVDQLDVAAVPQDTARRVGEFLALTQGQSQALGSYFAERRPRHSNPTPDDAVAHLDNLDWSREQKQTFRDVCGPQMERWGYDY
jgi:hypothetical protein